MPSSVGRIKWTRNLLNRIDEPMKILKTKHSVIEHKNAQLCVKYYNYMSAVLIHYEWLQHKAWFESAEQVKIHFYVKKKALFHYFVLRIISR